MRDHSSLETVWKMCDVLIHTGRHGFPQVEKLGVDMKNHLQTQLEVCLCVYIFMHLYTSVATILL